MSEVKTIPEASGVWGKYPNYDDIARFEYGRMMWKLPDMRARLLAHWLDERHPSRRRFLAQRELIERTLNSADDPEAIDATLREKNTTLRCISREIPPVFGDFF